MIGAAESTQSKFFTITMIQQKMQEQFHISVYISFPAELSEDKNVFQVAQFESETVDNCN